MSLLRSRKLVTLVVAICLAGCESTRSGAAADRHDRVVRGAYLTEGLLRCFICHSDRDWDEAGAPPVDEGKGAGTAWRDDGAHRLVAPNLTPDPETGAGRWTDAQLARAIRDGIAHDGRRLAQAMPTFRHLSDDDLAAVIAYLRSIPAIRNPLPRTALSDEEQAANDRRAQRPQKPLPLSGVADPVERGRRLVVLGECTGCHTSWHSPRMPGILGGGNRISRAGREAFSTNLTPHRSGLPYDADAFIYVMRTGKGGTLSGVMPWTVYRHLSDDDLRAIHAFLRTMHPVAHQVGNRGEPTFCSVCGQEHPLGELNRIERPSAVAVDPRLYDEYAGTYRSEEYGFTLTVTHDGDRLIAHWDDHPGSELIPQSETVFVEIGGVAPLRFVRGEGGRVAHVLSVEPENIVLEREH